MRRALGIPVFDDSSYDSIPFGVPQGSVLGPLLFVLYTADLVPLIQKHSLHCHLYADDPGVWVVSATRRRLTVRQHVTLYR